MLNLNRLAWLKAGAPPRNVAEATFRARLAGGGVIEKTLGPSDLVIARKALAEPLIAHTVSVLPVQDLNGYTNPWPAGGGKNLLNGDSFNHSGGKTVYLGMTDSTSFPYTLASGTYTLSVTPVSESHPFSLYCRESNAGSNTRIDSSTSNHYGTVTLAAGNYRFWAYNNTALTSSDLKNWQLEVGSTPTAWVPYSNICPISGRTGANVYHSGADTSDPTTYAISWNTEAGTVYGGTLNVLTGKLTVTHGYVDLGTKNWVASSNRFNTDSVVSGAKGGSHADCLCSMYKPDTGAATRSSDMSVCFANNGYVYIYDTSFSGDGTAFKTAMDGVQLVYALATPVEYTLSDSEIITLLKGTNNLWANCGQTTITYKRKK